MHVASFRHDVSPFLREDSIHVSIMTVYIRAGLRTLFETIILYCTAVSIRGPRAAFANPKPGA